MLRAAAAALLCLAVGLAHGAEPTIAATNSHVLVSKNDGSVVAWGSDFLGKLGSGRAIVRDAPVQLAGVPAIQQVAAYTYGFHVVARDSNGRVWTWGQNDFGQLGFRIPSTVVSPWTRGSTVDHTVYEHASIIKFIADNWGLPYLTLRERMTNSIESAFGGFTSFDPDPAFIPYEAPLHTYVEPTLEMLGIKTEDVTGHVGEIVGGVPIPVSRRKPSPPAPSAAAAAGGCDMYKLAESGFLDRLKVRTDYRFEDSYLRSRPELLAEAKAAL